MHLTVPERRRRMRGGVVLMMLVLLPTTLQAQTRPEVLQARSLMQQAAQSFARGSYSEARALLEQAATLRPRHPALLYSLARAAAAAGDHGAAVQRLHEAARLGLHAGFEGDTLFRGL